MFDQETLAKEVKQQSQQIAVTSKFMTMLGLGTAVKAGAAGLGAQYDSIVADAATNNVPKVAIIPQALIDLEEKVGKGGMHRILDSINTGVIAYRNLHGGAMTSDAVGATGL